jgi:hypothetical protein
MSSELVLVFQDYGIDFEDEKQPVKPFECLCGSRYCRGRGRRHPSTRLLSLLALNNIGMSLMAFLFCREEKHSSCCCCWGGRLMQCSGCLVREGGLIRAMELLIGCSGRKNVGWVVHFGQGMDLDGSQDEKTMVLSA